MDRTMRGVLEVARSVLADLDREVVVGRPRRGRGGSARTRARHKGFVDTATATCGEPWTTRPGNSSAPPAGVDGVVPMVVPSDVTKSGPVISGDTAEVVLVQVDPGYGPNPGHPGTGTVVGIVCGGSVITPN